MSLKSFFKSIGHGITNAVEDVAHGVEQGAKDIAKGVEGAVEHGAHALGDVMQGDFRGGLHELGQAGKAVGDTAKAEFKLGLTVGGAMTDLALGTVADAHLSKGLTKLAETAKGGLDKARDAVDKSLNQVVDSAEGAVAGGVRCVDDVAHGRFDRLGKDSLSVAGNAFNLCTSLTPEGMAANVGANLTRSFMDGTSLSKYADVVGDTMARKPLWMLRDGAKDVAEPLLDPLKKDLASADAAVDRTLDKAEDGISRTSTEAAVASGLAVQGDMTAQSQTPLLSEAQEDAIAGQLADALQGNLSTQDGRGDTPQLSEAQEDAIARQLADAMEGKDKQSGREEGLLASLFGEPALSASADVSFQLHTV